MKAKKEKNETIFSKKTNYFLIKEKKKEHIKFFDKIYKNILNIFNFIYSYYIK